MFKSLKNELLIKKSIKVALMEKREIEALFKNVTELADAKKLYKKLAKQLHPDVGGDEESFKALNAVYNHILEHGLFFSSEIEFDLDIEKIISQILHYENILIEVVGKWIWVSGDTKEIKEALLKRLKELYPSNVIFLHAYKYFREAQYPGVGHKKFTNWTEHKEWMRKEANRLERIAHNKKVSEEYK